MKRFQTPNQSSVIVCSTNVMKERHPHELLRRRDEHSENRSIQLNATDILLGYIHEAPLPISRSPDGSPQSRKGFVSISHTHGYHGVIYNPEVRVAIDIELSNRDVDHISGRFSDPDELALCSALLTINPAIAVWSCKECLFKLIGLKGVHFRDQLKCTHASPDGQSLWQVSHPKLNREFQLESRTFDGLICTFAERKL